MASKKSFAAWSEEKQTRENKTVNGKTFAQFTQEKRREAAAEDYSTNVWTRGADYLDVTKDLSRSVSEAPARARYGRGNIDLYDRPVYQNEDGTISTVDSFSTNIDGREILLPQIGRDAQGTAVRWTEDQAIDHYLKTGENLGIFRTPEEATSYAQRLHDQQEQIYSKDPLMDLAKETVSGGSVENNTQATNLLTELNQLRTERNNLDVSAYASGDPSEAMSAWERQQKLNSRISELEKQLESMGVDSKTGDMNIPDAAHSTIWKGISDIAYGGASTLDYVNRLGHYALGWSPAEYDAQNTWTSRLAAEQKRNSEYWANRGADAVQNDPASVTAMNLGAAVIQAVPSAVEAMLTGGGSLAADTAGLVSASNAAGITSKLGQLGNTIYTLIDNAIKNPLYWSSFWNVLGNGYEDAKANGASDANAVAYALTNGGINALIEIGGGVEKPRTELSWKDVAESAFEEGMEEVYQRTFEKGLEGMYGKWNPVFSTEDSDALFNPKEDLMDFTGGAVAGGFLGAGQAAVSTVLNAGRDANIRGDNPSAPVAVQPAPIAVQPAPETVNDPLMRLAEETVAQQPEDITQKRIRAIAEDPEQLAALGVETAGKTGAQVRAEIRAALESQNEQRSQANTDTVREYAASERAAERLTETGERIFSDFYTGGDPVAYLRGMTAAYNAGRNGKAIGSVDTSALTQLQRDAAYLAGQGAGRSTRAAQPNVDAIRAYTEAEQAAGRMTDDGARIIRDYYDPSGNVGAAEYVKAAVAAYNAGVKGESINTVTSPALTQTQRDAAYMAGRGAARQGQTVLAQANIPAAQQTVQQQTAQAQQTTAQQTTAQAQKNPAVRAENPGLVRDENAAKAKLTRRESRALDALGKILGKKIQFVESISADIVDKDGNIKKSGANAEIDGDTIRIALDSDDPFLTAAVHEVVHGIRDLDEASYQALAKFVANNLTDDHRKAAEWEEARKGYNPEQIPEEIVCDAFGRMLGDEALLQQFVQDDRTAAQKLFDALHDLLVKVQRALSGGGQKLTGNQRAVYSEFEGRLETMLSLFEEQLKNVSGVEGEANGAAKYSTPNTETKHSLKSAMATLNLHDEVRDGKRVWVDENGNVVTKITPKMVRSTGVGALIDIASQEWKDDNGNVIKPASISKKEADKQVAGATKLMNMILKAQDGELVWRFAGSAMFSAVKSNSDAQYGTTIDFSTVCRKTQEMMTAMSKTMVKLGRGLTKDEVIQLQKDILEENGTVPCPVCYVFSRWAGVGGILDNMLKWQNKYGHEYDDPAKLQARMDELKATTKTKKDLRAFLKENDATYMDMTGEREELQAERKKLNTTRRKLAKAGNTDAVTEIDERLKVINNRVDQLGKDIKAMEDSGAPELAWLDRVRSQPTYWTQGNVPANILFNMDDAATFAEQYSLAWGYRTSRGPSAGKAILPYSDMRLGDMILGPKNGSAAGNTTFRTVKDGFNADQKRAFKNALKRTLAQNLIGGQRFQSTSDFRYDYGLDYLQVFWEAQALGSKMQTYTKVIEFAEIVAAVGGDCNLSVMPLEQGYDENGRLKFSAVTGIDIEAASKANAMYDNVQLILVGINDEHIRLALLDSEDSGGNLISFVIPYHASGASINNFIRGLVQNLGESFNEEYYKDYSPVQNDSERKNATAEQKQRAEIRKKILTGYETVEGNRSAWTPSEEELRHIRGTGKDISTMSFEELLDIERRALAGDRDAIREYESWSAGVLWDLYQKMWVDRKAADTYGVRLSTKQAEHIMPHEYWFKDADRSHAYLNGFIFRSYCYSLGLTPRFTGIDSAGRHIGYGDFTDSPGYWKTLIDRPMYANDGTYREQQKINITELSPEMLTPEYGEKNWGGYRVAEPDEQIAEKASQRFVERAQGKRYSLKQLSDEHLAAAERGDMETAERLMIEAAKAAGYPVRAWHQTAHDFTVFNTNNPGAALNDSETPNGIFFKTNDHDIGLDGKKQMAVFINPGRMLDFKNREEANAWYRKHIDGYDELSKQMEAAIRPLDKKMESIESQMFSDGTTDEEYQKLDVEWNDLLSQMHEVEDRYRGQLRDLLNEYFLGENRPYDSIHLGYDGHRYVDGKRENVETYILFSNTQVKSADPITYDDAGKPIPLSERFNPKNEDIRHSRSGRDVLDEYVEQFGAIKTGEKPARDVTMPKRTTPKTKVGQTIRTFAEAPVTPENMLPTLEEMVANHEFDYPVYSDEKAIKNAESYIEKKGYQKALTDWTNEVKNGGVSKTNTAVGLALYNNAVNSGDMKTGVLIWRLMAQHERSAGQAVQAMRILKKLSPEWQLYNANMTVADLNAELKKRLGKDAPDIEIDEDLAEMFLRAKTQEDRDRIMKMIYQDIGRRTPPTFLDRWTALRYTAMLGNPRTIVRNIVGNAGFAPIVAAKDLTATAIEGIVSKATGGKIERTKGNVIGRGDLLKAAWDDYANMQEIAMGESKYSDRQAAKKEIHDAKIIFGNTKSKAWNKTGGRVLEWWRTKTGKAMDGTDVIFNKPQYVLAMAQYCAANGISAEQIRSGKGLDAARSYAVREAQKATYRDTNDFSQMVSSLGKSWLKSENKWKRGIATLGEGVLPFRKTPANILARGMEYSPIGLIKSLTYDLAQVQKGDMSAADMIDDVSAGLTGTGLVALGVYLAAQGLLRGRGRGDDKKKNFDKLQGHQNYALELPNGTSITLDWLAPEALPLFIGANLWETSQEEKDGLRMKDILSAVSNITEPMLQMSMLQSLNDLLDGGSYGDDDVNALMKKLSSAATSYLTQPFPTLFGQVERTGETKRMMTYIDKNKFLMPGVQKALGKISAKIPGWDFQQIPYIDAWGREELTGKFLERAGNNFLNPSFASKISDDDLETELVRLYDVTGENVFPERANTYITTDGERKDLNAEEYLKYATAKGRTSYAVVGGLLNSSIYKGLPDDEKAACVKYAYDYASQTAKTVAGGSIPTSYKWVKEASEGVSKGIAPETYILAMKAVKSTQGIKGKNGKTITNSADLAKMQAIYNIPGLNDSQRQYLFACFDVGSKVIGYNKTLVDQKLAEMKNK